MFKVLFDFALEVWFSIFKMETDFSCLYFYPVFSRNIFIMTVLQKFAVGKLILYKIVHVCR